VDCAKSKQRTKIIITPLQSKQNSKFAFFSRKTAFERQKFATNFRFEQIPATQFQNHHPTISFEKFSGLVDFIQKIPPVFRTRPT
jgi:hypothetical protein